MTSSFTNEQLDAALLNFASAVDGASATNDYVLTTERVDLNFEEFGQAIDFFLRYPDVFLDIITPTDSGLKLFPFQRVSLRAKMRNRQVFETATRGASKSWGAFASRYLTCMFVPAHTSFVCTDVKEQAASIAKEKIQDDLWVKYPLLENEMVKYRVAGGALRDSVSSTKMDASYRFTSGSKFDVVGITSARGKRRHSGLIEEVIEQDQTAINEKIIPLMNIDRRTVTGYVNPREQFNQQKIFVTSAGYMGTFAYDKMIETLLWMVLYPEDYFMVSLDYRIPLKAGLLNATTIREVRSSPSFDIGSFKREYDSKWSGEMKGAAFGIKSVQNTRKIRFADFKEKNLHPEDFYIIGADMAKDGAAKTAISVIRVRPGETSFSYHLVNGYIASSSDYQVVSNEIKHTAMQYNTKLIVVDANGVGASIRDWLNKPGHHHITGEPLPGFGIMNPPTNVEKDLIKYSTNNIVYEIKANGTTSSLINWFFFSRMNSGFFRMLIGHREAVELYGKNKQFPYLDLRKQQSILRPYQFCDKLEGELLNLDILESNTGGGDSAMKLKRRNNSIQKDLFSSVSYAMYGCNQEIEQAYYKKKHRKTNKMTDFVMISGTMGGN